MLVQLDRPLRVITPTVDGDVLTALARAEAEFTPPELHRIIGSYSTEGIRKALARLVDQGIVTSHRVGNARAYRLNRAHLAAPAVEALADLKGALLSRLRTRLAAWEIAAAYAALFGSGAHGPMRAESDLDVFVVRPAEVDPDDDRWREQLASLARDVWEWTGNDLRILEYDTDEVARGRASNASVLRDIATEGIRLAGPADHLTQRHQDT